MYKALPFLFLMLACDAVLSGSGTDATSELDATFPDANRSDGNQADTDTPDARVTTDAAVDAIEDVFIDQMVDGDVSVDQAVDADATIDQSMDAPPMDAGPPPALNPRIIRVETLTNEAQTSGTPNGAPGNAWGAHQAKIVRTQSGVVYAVYSHSPSGISDPSQAQWVLMRRGAAATDTFQEVDRQRAGRDPVHLLKASDDSLHIFGWPGTPQEWTVRGNTVTGPTSVPGGWQQLSDSSTPYSGVAISSDDKICMTASRGSVGNGTYTSNSAWDLACRPAGGTWSAMQTFNIGLRYCYPYLHAYNDNSFDLIGTRDILFDVGGYASAPGGSTYLLDAVDVWRFPTASSNSPERVAVGEAPRETPVNNAPRYWQGDSHVDLKGRLHILLSTRRTTGNYQLRHAIVETNGTVRSAPITLSDYTDGSMRIIEDQYGRFFLVFVQRNNQYLFTTTDEDGLVLGQRLDLTSQLTGGSGAGAASVTNVRSGSARSGTLDLIIGVNGGAEVRYARIQLHQ